MIFLLVGSAWAWESGAAATTELAVGQALAGSIWAGVLLPRAAADEGSAALGLGGGLAGAATALGVANGARVSEADAMWVDTGEIFTVGLALALGEATPAEDTLALAAVALPAGAGLGIALAATTEVHPGDLAAVRLGTTLGLVLADTSFVAAPAQPGGPVAARFLAGGLAGAGVGAALALHGDPKRSRVNLIGASATLFGTLGYGAAATLDADNAAARTAVVASALAVGIALPAALPRSHQEPKVTLIPSLSGIRVAASW